MEMEEALKQRKIGQQIMIVRMVLSEYDRAWPGGMLMSNLTSDLLYVGVDFPNDEVDTLLKCIPLLYEKNLYIDAAHEYAREMSGKAFGFFYETFKKLGHVYSYIKMKEGFVESEDGWKELGRINADENIKKGYVVDGEIQSESRFIDALEYYFDFCIKRILYVLDKGYDWDVITEMLRENEKTMSLLKDYIAHHRHA